MPSTLRMSGFSIFGTVAVSLGFSGSALAQGLAGDWAGYWTRNGDTLSVTMAVRRDTNATGYSATFSSDRLRVSGIPFADVRMVDAHHAALILRGDRTTTSFSATLDGDSLRGSFLEGLSEGRVAFGRSAIALPPIDEREITFMNGDVRLAGTLFLPHAPKPTSAVVFLHGSGPEGRWASRFLAITLAERGVAALAYDKRGVGGSTGDWRTASIDDLAAAAVAAIARVAQESTVDASRIGIHGHSQGGTLAPLVADRSGRVAFVVASAAAGIPTDSTELFSLINAVYPLATTSIDSAHAREYVAELVESAYKGKAHARLDSLAKAHADRPWFFASPPAGDSYWTFSRSFDRFAPLAAWKKVRVPVLLLYGGADQRIPATESAKRISATLHNAGNENVTVRIFPDADHTFRLAPGPGGWPTSAPLYLGTLIDWIVGR